MKAAQPDVQPCMKAASELSRTPPSSRVCKGALRATVSLFFTSLNTNMSNPSFADGGSTDVALEQLERPLIDTTTGRRVQAANYTSLPADEYATSHQASTANWFYRITLDTWVPETLALFISAAPTVAITAILKHYDSTK